jgi:hypothetical protein
MADVKVFIAGSRAVSRLNDAIRERLDRVMSEHHGVLIGDANGADRAVQQYLSDRRYRDVTVFCTGTRCRNNVGKWRTMSVAPPQGVHSGFEFYAVKDREMASCATHGLMLWDGESRGTFTNIGNLVLHNKPVVVYLSPTRTFVTVKTQGDVDQLLAQAAPSKQAITRPA